MRLAPALLVWVMVTGVFASFEATTTTSHQSHRLASAVPAQHRGGSGRRGSVRAASSPARLIEGSDDTVETYSKNQPGRHVCTKEQAVTEPVRTRESYCRPVYKTYTLPCEQGKTCRRYRVTYETAYRDVLKTRVSHKTSYSCCPGWAQGSKVNHGCTKAICIRPCQNGGACLKPDFCGCRPGFTGKNCEIDLDECISLNNSCEHSCVNTHGSYQCRCRHGYTLNPDRRTCRVLGPNIPNTTPAVSRDREELEDDDEDERDFTVEYVNLTRRISKLEKLMKKPLHTNEGSAFSLNELNNKIKSVSDTTSKITSQVDRLERRMMEIYHKNKRGHNHVEDPRIDLMAKKLALLEERLNECNCLYDAANKVQR